MSNRGLSFLALADGTIQQRGRAVLGFPRGEIPESVLAVFGFGAVHHSGRDACNFGISARRHSGMRACTFWLCCGAAFAGRWCWRAQSPTLGSKGARLLWQGPTCPWRVQGWHPWRTRCSCNVQVPLRLRLRDVQTTCLPALRGSGRPTRRQHGFGIGLRFPRLRKKQQNDYMLSVVNLSGNRVLRICTNCREHRKEADQWQNRGKASTRNWSRRPKKRSNTNMKWQP
jgi:hypothetical protein